MQETVRVGNGHGAGPSAADLAQRLMGAQQPATLRALGLWLAGHIETHPRMDGEQLAREGPERLGASFPWTLGRLGSARHVPLLVPWLESDDSEDLYRSCSRLPAPRSLPTPSSCRPSEHREATEAARASADASSCLALGLLGTPEAVALLRERLDAHPMAAHAANALQLALGNGPDGRPRGGHRGRRRRANQPRAGTARAGDQTIGVERVRLRRLAHRAPHGSLPASHMRARFHPDQRARLGMPLSLASNILVLAHPQTPPSTALLCAEDRPPTAEWTSDFLVRPRMVRLQRAGRAIKATNAAS